MGFKLFKKSWYAWVICLSFFLTGMAASPPLVGGPAPPFQLETVNGRVVSLSDFKGQFVILNFWATWCAPCTREMPEFQKIHQASNLNVKIIGINMAESKEKVSGFIHQHGLSFPILLDPSGNVSQDYEILHLPVTYFISPDGFVRDKIFGGVSQYAIQSKIQQWH